MTAKQFEAILDRLGLSQLGAARLLDVNDRSVRHWVAGTRKVSAPAARFLQYLVATKQTGEQALQILGE
jgi:DNA-binding transcriptional regulator YiaG